MKGSIAIIGSGLTAVAACKELIANGIKPVVLDTGLLLPASNQKAAATLSTMQPSLWPQADKHTVNQNPTLTGRQYPRKLLFGSDYFYGNASDIQIHCQHENSDSPPYTHAKGGFSVGWGATALFPDATELQQWPVTAHTLQHFYEKVIADLPYSAVLDELAEHFPLSKTANSSITLDGGNETLLKRMRDAAIHHDHDVAFGQSRLLMNANACHYCGSCLSGCVYSAIYKADSDIDKMIKAGQIDYRPGHQVELIEDSSEGTRVFCKTREGENKVFDFSRVLLAAGAVNSTSIVMRSKRMHGQQAIIKTTLGFIAPMISFKPLPSDWPTSNTMPAIFLEYKAGNLSDRWIHTQVSIPNELVRMKLGIQEQSNSVFQTIRKKVATHLAIAHGNMHSDHANHYELTLSRDAKGRDQLIASRQPAESARDAVQKAVKRLSAISKKFGFYIPTPFVQDTTASHGYHLGGSLPMKKSPSRELDTDILGRPAGWLSTHVIDSSVLPSIPATTIGLLSMANAARITSEIISLTKNGMTEHAV